MLWVGKSGIRRRTSRFNGNFNNNRLQWCNKKFELHVGLGQAFCWTHSVKPLKGSLQQKSSRQAWTWQEKFPSWCFSDLAKTSFSSHTGLVRGLHSLLIRMGHSMNLSSKSEERKSVRSDLRQLVSFCRAEPQRAWTTSDLGRGERRINFKIAPILYLLASFWRGFPTTEETWFRFVLGKLWRNAKWPSRSSLCRFRESGYW